MATATDAAEALHTQLEESVRKLVTSDDWLAALKVASRFHDYSFANTMLIVAEAERRGLTPTRVAGYRKWQELGRQVRRGEKGIPILAPLVRKVAGTEPDQPHPPDADQRKEQEETRLVGFRVVHVFDITQTDGPPLPDITPRQLVGDLPRQWDQLVEMITGAGFTLGFDDPAVLDGANGITHWDRRHVTLRNDLSGAQRFKTAAHELGHIRLHDPHGGTRPACRGVVEVEAESVAYIVSASAGIDTATYSLPYVAAWAKGDTAVVARTAQRVIDCARSILPGLERDRRLEPDRPHSASLKAALVLDRERPHTASDNGPRQPLEGVSMSTIETPDHGPVLTQSGGCASCGADPTQLVVYDGPAPPGRHGYAYNELACPDHAQRARRGGAMVYPSSVIPDALITRARRHAEQQAAAATDVLNHAITHYQGWLDSPAGEPARRHLTDRGLSATIVEQFQLGYAPPAWRTLTTALHGDGFTAPHLVAAGVAVRARDGRLYDTMRGRLVLPIHDRHGHPRGFAGRLIEGDGPRYLNTPETILYRKGELLYGHHHARAGIVDQGVAVVVEGYTDTLAAHQAGMTNTVAVGGTAITAHHLAALRGTTHRITLALDGDPAGALAARRVHDIAGQADPDLDIRVATLPPGRDPADLIAHGDADLLRQALTDAVPLPIHLIDRLLDARKLDNPEDKWHALRATTAVVLGITDPNLRAAAVDHLARRLDWDAPAVENSLTYHHAQARTTRRPARDSPSFGRAL
jgi:DNA primase catalytic core